MKFSELDINPQILKGLTSMGYRELTPIQELTFPHILAGKDLLATAETGSGKTSACGIPLVQRVDPDLRAIQALILVPAVHRGDRTHRPVSESGPLCRVRRF